MLFVYYLLVWCYVSLEVFVVWYDEVFVFGFREVVVGLFVCLLYYVVDVLEDV